MYEQSALFIYLKMRGANGQCIWSKIDESYGLQFQRGIGFVDFFFICKLNVIIVEK